MTAFTAQDDARIRATETLAFYLRSAYQAAGLKWDADNQSEVEGIVADIIFASTPEKS